MIVEGQRTFRVPFSIVSQVDGLMPVLLRMRVERDVYARDEQTSACRQYGCEWLRVVGSSVSAGFFEPWTEAERKEAFIDDRESTTVLEGEALFRLLVKGRELISNRRVAVQVDNASLV